MSQWQVKDLSNITGVSVQTLHHYDRIDLLKPSLRLPNGYRLYSEKDLIKLQKVLALKFFGFELAQIKKLLSEEVDLLEHFQVQAKFLDQKAAVLKNASQALKKVLAERGNKKSILTNELYSKELADLLHTIWNKGSKNGESAGELIPSDTVQCLDQAIDAYYRTRIYDILDQASENPSKQILQQWNELLEEMYGNSEPLKQDLIKVALSDERVNQKARAWLQKYYQSP